MKSRDHSSRLNWQVLIALVVVEFLEMIMSDAMTLNYLLPSSASSETVELGISIGLSSLVLIAWLMDKVWWARVSMFVFAGWVTIGLIFNVFALVYTMPARIGRQAGFGILADALIVWLVNVLIFAVWYWLMDSKDSELYAPTRKHRQDFAFPQQSNNFPGWERWKPGFIDYLFLAFNTSTAFSPTDTIILSPLAKMLTMVQASVSLITLAMLAAFGVNILAR
jgi:hypothetical protein